MLLMGARLLDSLLALLISATTLRLPHAIFCRAIPARTCSRALAPREAICKPQFTIESEIGPEMTLCTSGTGLAVPFHKFRPPADSCAMIAELETSSLNVRPSLSVLRAYPTLCRIDDDWGRI